MNKAQIIQRLLDDKHITVEEAMTLMTQDPIPMPTHINPYTPPFKVGDTDWTWDPNRNPIWYGRHTSGTDLNMVYETSGKSEV